MSTHGPVIIVEYGPQWPLMFQEERGRILGAIERSIVSVEHVGSTAVPGLGAKPIVDIIVGVRDLTDATACIAPLRDIGYVYVPEYEDEIPERRYFRKGPPGTRTHHLHMVEVTSGFWERHLLFRDFLRANPLVAQQYYEVKKELAARYGSDREGYTEAKTPFIESALVQARASTRL